MRPAALILAVSLVSCATRAPGPVTTPDGYRVSGPYVHANLAVYLIHMDRPDDREFITLEEGLKSGLVTVTEKDDAQVNQLLLENRSDKALFIQEGDRLQGGKQDRIIATSFVVPPKSDPRPIPAFCIEQGRWQESSLTGSTFRLDSDSGVALKGVRTAAKVEKDQGEVWEKVAEAKRIAARQFAAPNTNDSLNETMDSEEVRKATEAYARALEALPHSRADAVGMAFAVNGVIEEANVYPGPALFRKVYPKLLRSYALQAVLKVERKEAPPAVEVVRFLKEGTGRKKAESIDALNRLELCEDERRILCETEYDGLKVHRQVLRRE